MEVIPEHDGTGDVAQPSSSTSHGPNGTVRRAQLLAWISLLSCLLLLVLVVGFAVRNATSLLLGLIGVLCGLAGGWWVASGRSTRRTLGFAGVLLGAALVITGGAPRRERELDLGRPGGHRRRRS